MGKNSGIAWTDHTFNPWWGCVKVSPACANCYAESRSKWLGYDIWGPDTPRRTFGEKHWNEPLAWDKAAAAAGKRDKVFCASMADIGERHPTAAELRSRVWDLIWKTPNLDWLLLSKWDPLTWLPPSWEYQMPGNVWLGTTVETQDYDERIDDILRFPAAVHFVSYEPGLGPLDLSHWLDNGLDWVQIGGESGAKARPFELRNAIELVEQIKAHGRHPFVKQIGRRPVMDGKPWPTDPKDTHGNDMDKWPAELRIQEFPK